ncbi:transducin/WD40 repeat-like superfamily protein isoform X2 [Wolffia australiana]
MNVSIIGKTFDSPYLPLFCPLNVLQEEGFSPALFFAGTSNVPEDPLQGDFPEVIEEYLQHGSMKCIAFNRRGTLLAAGCADGSCVIWDFGTRGIARELRDEDCVAPITSVCWSKLGQYLLAAATDKSLTLWHVRTGEKTARITLQQTTMHARLHPGASRPSICLACPLSSAPILVNLDTGSSTVLPVESAAGPPAARNRFADGSPPFTPTAATFNKQGDLVYVGNSKGEILVVDSETARVRAAVPVAGGSVIKNIVFSRDGRHLLTNSNDRVIRVYENLLPAEGAAGGLAELGGRCLRLCREFSDAVTRVSWKATCFSGDGEWVVGASGNKGEHKIYIWDRAGRLVKILEGPKEALTDLCWHPVRPLVASASISGLVYIWAKDYTENWSAFAPDFKELEENEEYVEREDEFDLIPDLDKKEVGVDEDAEVDIMGTEKDSAFSDSDESQELCFLPAEPAPDAEEEDREDKYAPGSPKVGESAQSVSPETAQNGNLAASSPAEAAGNNSSAENGGGTGSSKRKRKPSAKGLELQAEKGRKPSAKSSSKAKNKPPECHGALLEDAPADDGL